MELFFEDLSTLRKQFQRTRRMTAPSFESDHPLVMFFLMTFQRKQLVAKLQRSRITPVNFVMATEKVQRLQDFLFQTSMNGTYPQSKTFSILQQLCTTKKVPLVERGCFFKPGDLLFCQLLPVRIGRFVRKMSVYQSLKLKHINVQLTGWIELKRFFYKQSAFF